jgi:hypothetical protein
MRKLVLGLMGAAALAFGSGAANAAVTINGTNMTSAGALDGGLNFSAGFFELGGSSPFDAWLTFTETLDGYYGFTLTTTNHGKNGSATDVDFDVLGVYVTDGTNTWNLTPDIDNNDFNEDFALLGQFLKAGTYTLHIKGTRGNFAAFSGDISFGAVPEPSTWAMMLLGFGAVGFAMRRRRRPALLQVA